MTSTNDTPTGRHFAFVAYSASAAEQARLADQVAAVRRWWNPSTTDDDLFAGRPVTRAELDGLQTRLGQVPDGSVVAVYITGHGSPAYSRYRLEAADGVYDPVPMVERLIDSAAGHGLVIIDSCYAHKVEAPVKTFHGDVRRDPARDPDRTLPQVVVIVTGTADDPYQTPGFAELTSMLDEAIELLKDERYQVPASRQFLTPNELRAVLDEVAAQRVRAKAVSIVPNMVVPASQYGVEESHALPNPAYVSTRIDEYWIGRVKGAPVTDPGWYFTGRAPVMQQVVAWLADPDAEPLLVVTGARGTGKSAVLARTVTLADAGFRADPQYARLVDDVPAHLTPPDAAVDVAVDTRGRSPERVADLVLRALAGPTAPRPERSEQLSVRERVANGLLAFAGTHGRPACVVLDGIDESSDPTALVHDVLAALTRTGLPDGSPAARTIVGVRDDPRTATVLPGIKALVDHRTVRTDEDDARTEVHEYSTGLLRRSHGPYRPRPDLEAEVSRWLSRQDPPSFLNAGVVADALSRGTDIDLDDLTDGPDLVERVLPTMLRLTLAEQAASEQAAATTRTPTTACDYLAALRALALARGAGTPWRDVWPTMAAAVAGDDPPDMAKWNTVIRQVLRGPLGVFVMTAAEDGQRVFRPVHDTVTTTLTDRPATVCSEPHDQPPPAEADATVVVQARIAAALGRLVPPEDPPDPYVCRHLVGHATYGQVLTDQTIPERFLVWDTSRSVRGRLGLPLPDSPETHILSAWAAVEPHLDQIGTLDERRTALRFQLLGAPSVSGWRTWADRNVLVSTPGLLCMAVEPSMGVVVTGSVTGTIRLWSLRTGKPTGPPLSGHSDWVSAVAFGHVEGRTLLATSHSDRTVRLWDPATGEPVGEPLHGHTGVTSSLAFGTAGGRAVLATGSAYGTVGLWDPTTGETIGEPLPQRARGVVALGDVGARTVLATGNYDGTVRLWDPTTADPIAEPLHGHTREVSSVAFDTVDGRPVLATGSYDHTVRLWDATTGEAVGGPLRGHTKEVLSVAFGTVDGRSTLASGGHDRTVRLWDPATGEPLGDPLRGHTSWVSSVAFGTVDARAVLVTASDHGTVRLWDPHPDAGAGHQHSGGILSVAFDKVGSRKLMATASLDGALRLWDPATAEPVGAPLETGDWTLSVAFAKVAGRTVLAAAGTSGTVQLWDAATCEPVGAPMHGHVDAVRCVVFGTVGERTVVATASEDRTARLWDAATGAPLGEPLRGHTADVTSVAFGKAGGRTVVATASNDGTVRLWDPTTGAPVGEPLRGHAGPGPGSAEPAAVARAHPNDWVSCVAFGRAGGRTILAAGANDGTVQLWDPATGDVGGDRLHHTDWVWSVAFGRTCGRTILATGSRDGTVQMWDPGTGRPASPAIHVVASVNALTFTDGALAVATAAGVALLRPEFLDRVLRGRP
ncbi:MAG: hypothetical protein FWE61_04595 [Micrococcales bacterium]|nr:hypothetical protein [Micrococcales bacterium]